MCAPNTKHHEAFANAAAKEPRSQATAKLGENVVDVSWLGRVWVYTKATLLRTIGE